jgi:hypothetical protein
MPISFSPVWVPIILFGLIGLYLAIHRQFRFDHDRTIDEVTVFFRKLDWSEAEDLFDVTRERYLRIVQSNYHFRRTMRVRIHEAREFLWRMYHNVRVVHEWANTELRDIGDKAVDAYTERERLVLAIADKAAHFRVFATFRLVELTVWTLLRVEKWRVIRIPSVAALRKCGGEDEFDLLDLYSQLRNAAADLALTYGKDFYDDMLALL